ncbi:MAG TPA: cytochrome c oxidase assembly protein [Acidimicrobiales bacterium]|nr:cytochrome c oxidase assembly protein [Acidimicrobiales bacterium]
MIGTLSSAPWAFDSHPLGWLALALVGVLYGLAIYGARRAGAVGASPTNRQRWFLTAALLTLAIALTWPVADLAAHSSLSALVVQRLLLTLAVAPLLLLATPAPVLSWLTRPPILDDALEFLTKPVVAVITFTAIVVGTLLTPAVAAQSSSAAVRAATDALLIFAGFVLWGPVLRHIPGASRTVAIGTAAYLFVQSVVPGFPALVFIFSKHPIYPAFAGSHSAIGLSPLNDQQLAGILAKLATIPVLWTVAWVVLTRAHKAEHGGTDDSPLTWADVERRLQRAERQEKRAMRSRFRPVNRSHPLRPLAGSSPTAPEATSPTSNPRPGPDDAPNRNKENEGQHRDEPPPPDESSHQAPM